MTTPKHLISLYGYLGSNPEAREVPEKTILRWHYDPARRRALATPISRPARPFHIFSLKVFDKESADVPQRIQCIDWRGQIVAFRKGQRLRLTGFFNERTLTRDGRPRKVRQFVVKSAELAQPYGRR